MVKPIVCVHCGTETKHAITEIINGQELDFCCSGCVRVYMLLHEEDSAPPTPTQKQDPKKKDKKW